MLTVTPARSLHRTVLPMLSTRPYVHIPSWMELKVLPTPRSIKPYCMDGWV